MDPASRTSVRALGGARKHALLAAPERARRATPFGEHVAETPIFRRFAHDHDHVDACGEPRRALAKRSAHEAFGSIAHDGSADLTRGRDAEPRGAFGLLAREDEHEVLGVDPFAALLDALELGALADVRRVTR